MTKKDKLLTVLSDATAAGGGIYTAQEIAYLIGEKYSPALTKFLADCAKKGLIRRVAAGLFESTLTPPAPTTAIYKIAKKLRNHVISYISLESQLSHTGTISQIPMGRLTIVTKGRSGTFTTPYGVIEFTHSKKSVSSISPNLYFDSTVNMYRANTSQAIADLKDCKRNLHMLER
ncbi:hypothetical protein GZ77_17510 [Endozoicomonas montiporae]|uniref:Uncharacterized protein n=2 Tax=Endozoicomonas montiporae TaxID=1027273 RepID=A0A081N1M7_9GAMM|nr:hypothetical protein [Endozoicomonas montiporae]AMO58718.1 hypothetical protein EZMO1_4822 [Endozoicomonas montiporae CL-33]KEQ12350.1 hypothetical protein GZ77_17510 [Endozoicomonas montiporae]